MDTEPSHYDDLPSQVLANLIIISIREIDARLDESAVVLTKDISDTVKEEIRKRNSLLLDTKYKLIATAVNIYRKEDGKSQEILELLSL